MRVLTITVEVKDDEYQNFINRLADSGKVSVQDGATGDNDEPGVQVSAGALDKNGVPWLETVHAATKTQTKEGAWKRLKGVTEEQKIAAENAWRAANPAPFVTGNNPPITIPVSAPPLAIPGLPGMPPVGGLPGMPAPAPVAPQPVSYADIQAKFAELTPTGKFGPNFEALTGANGIYSKLGITDVNVLHTDENLRRNLLSALNAL